ncbi:transporter substrate-binding domain-containing protein [Microvirga pudoricolor]|uniref:transporter substrate-binding domain-containing protein n=1 Tax=Microvirga pudoricolor TaxID=2778729 RepID=UPI001950C9E2|nr:transporter substrate-binding domain-containing protein [Microvirga pudoricolor]MBM6593162.1 transporter substrate-binding domain-containing protein [Microvirga pudoricolor]
MTNLSKILRGTVASLGFAAAVASFAASASAQSLPPVPKAIKDAGVIKIGVKCDSPPFGSSGPDGKPLGIEVEMAKQIGTYALGSPDKAELSCVATDARIPSLTGGKIDLIIATLGKTPPREQVIDYSDIYYWGSSRVIVPKDSAVQKLADLDGKSMLIVKGGSQLKWLKDRIPGIQFVQLNTNADNIQALQQGRGDGYVGDAITIATLASNYPNLRVLNEEVDLGFNGVGIRKNEPELKAFVNAVLKKLKDEKYFSKTVPTFVTDPVVAKEMIKSFETNPPATN